MTIEEVCKALIDFYDKSDVFDKQETYLLAVTCAIKYLCEAESCKEAIAELLLGKGGLNGERAP